MIIKPNTPKRLAAAAIAIVGVLAAFNLLKHDQVVAVTAAIAAFAAVWHPKTKSRKDNGGPTGYGRPVPHPAAKRPTGTGHQPIDTGAPPSRPPGKGQGNEQEDS